MSYADAWQKWFHVIERGASCVNEKMVALADLQAAHAVLDIGTGIGEPALTAAKVLNNSGRVTAVDCDPQMIARGRERAQTQHIANIEYRVMRAEELRLPAQSFDAVLARWSMMFVEDLPSVYCIIRRLLRPGGRFVSAIWGPPDKVPALSLATRVAHEQLGLEPPRFGQNTAFALSDIDATAKQVRDAGFTDTSGEWIKVVYEFPTPDMFIEFRTDCATSFAALMQAASAERRRNMRTAIARALEPYRLADGSVRMENWAYCVTAHA